MRKTVFIIFFLSSILSFGQKEASNWYFGENAGIRFNADGTVSELTDGQLNTIEGCTTISDANGNLLFYTDGITVWNRLHQPMSNANGALGNGLFGDPSSTQSALVVPKPGDPNIHYIFTVDTAISNNDVDLGFNYSVVDMTLNGGLGNVTLKNSNLLQDSSEKITAVVKDCVTQSIWVITLASENGEPSGVFNTFHAYEVNSLGLNTTPVSSTFTTYITDGRGYLKLSPDGTKLVSANAGSGLYIYDFDKATGVVSNETQININFSLNGSKPQVSYGIEFSQNNELLYVSTFYMTDQSGMGNPAVQYGALLQYNLNAPNISSSEIVIDSRQTYRGGLQLGPNGKIYRAMNTIYNSGTPYLSVINNPNSIGTACNYVNNALSLSRNVRQGLPPFISSFFSEKIDIIGNNTSSTSLSLCDATTYTLAAEDIPGATYIWKRNDVILPENDFDLVVDEDGLYYVFVDPNAGCESTLEGEAYVTFNPNPIANDYTLIQCDEDGIIGGLTRFNLNEANDALTMGIPNFSVKFYKDIARTNEIINSNSYNYDVGNPLLIYTKIINDATGCFDFSELTLEVIITQINDFLATPLCDEVGSEDGFNTFNLNEITNNIQNFNSINFPISYFRTYEDALLEQNILGNSFVNTQPYSQTIFARAENDNNCYGISKVLLTVNKLPNIEVEELTYYCLNKFPESITLNAGVLNDSINNYLYTWSTGEDTYEIEINQSGTYSVTITNANGCSKVKTITVVASNIATFETISVQDVTENNTVIVVVSGEGTYEYRLLDQNNSVYAPFQINNIFENVKPGFYAVSVKDVKNDCGSVNEKISVIGFPKFFTPNGDGYNDTWQVYGVSGVFQPNSKILIFNRFGKLIKEITPFEKGWDGLVNGEKLPVDDYWFSVKLQDGRIFKNHFALKR
jgi:gliding motility-associated-like protein